MPNHSSQPTSNVGQVYPDLSFFRVSTLYKMEARRTAKHFPKWSTGTVSWGHPQFTDYYEFCTTQTVLRTFVLTSYLFCAWVTASKHTAELKSRGGKSDDNLFKSHSTLLPVEVWSPVISSTGEFPVSVRSSDKDLTLTKQSSKLATSNAPRIDERVSQASHSLHSSTVTCSSVSPGFSCAPHQPNRAELDWVLERFGQ